ncbi:hypothetical protein RND81_08G226200 [Saponaria officinalis]|uniref:DRBM domain-containing protein n=1 Tax=Saponaria officinalis TaxID=3572 RepID=A0AAW1JAK6_SAPOF
MAEQITFMQHLDHQQFQIQSSTSQMNGQITPQELLQPPCVKEPFMYKNRLQEFAQRANLQLPSYHTVNEQELRQVPKFRSTVEVDGEKYTSTNTFTTRKAAEQDVAKLALESISKKIKNCVSRNTKDGGFPPIHEDRVFSKSILHEFAAKKNLEKPTYDTVKLESALPLFVSSLVFDGVKYTGEPSVNKKEAEQLAARAVILSILANSGVDTLLSEIVKSKAKLISAVQPQCNQNASVSHLPNSGSNVETSAVKESGFGNVQETVDMIENGMSEGLQQQSASKKARFPDIANESTEPMSETQPQFSLLPTYQTLPQPSLLPRYQTLPQPNSQTLSQSTSLLPNTQTISQPSLLPNPQTLPQPSLLLSTQTPPQPSLLSNSQTVSQLSLPPSTQTHPQPSLQPNSQTLFQPPLLPSTQTHPQPSLPISSQTLPESNSLPVTSVPSIDAQIPSSETASSRRRKNKKANKKAKIQMQLSNSNMLPSQVPSCTIGQ